MVLDLTATPKENSNIISFVSALKLKQEHMVKLPVVVYNHHKKEEVINSALHLQRQLELLAKEEETITGKYIRPIILFQAQSNIKGKDNTTFQKIKEQLVKLRIPEEQIKIKVSGIDELKGINLMDRNCPVRYIITVNALKEGWDCPNAYILASLADKSSPVEVEQILGRVLRQPYVTKHNSPLLNMSFVLTASARFNDTLDNIVKGLQDAGFSKEDYFAEELPEPKLTNEDILQQDLFENPIDNEVKSDDDFNISAIDFNPDEEVTLESYTNNITVIGYITEKAVLESKVFEEKIINLDIDDNTTFFTEVMKQTPKRYALDKQFESNAKNIVLPQFFIKNEDDDYNEYSLFEELNQVDFFIKQKQVTQRFQFIRM